MQEELLKRHSVIIEDRKNTVISGIKSVESYSPDGAELISCMGNLTIKGENLKIEAFSQESGEAHITGTVIAIVYTTDTAKGGILSRLFR